MMNEKEIEEKLNAMESVSHKGKAEVRALLVALGHLTLPKTGRWKPSKSEFYWYYHTSMGTDCLQWKSNNFDRSQYAVGNCFRTLHEANSFSSKRLARNRLELLAHELNGRSVLPRSMCRYYIWVGHNGSIKVKRCLPTHHLSHDFITFHSFDAARQALDQTSKADLNLIFGTDHVDENISL